MRARAAFMAAADKDEVVAQALGITAEDLQTARDEGKNVRDLVNELELDPATVREDLKAAHEAALQQAVDDGVITQEQADLLADNPRPAQAARPGLRGRAIRAYHHEGVQRGKELMDGALAEALGISVEELQAAREEALPAAVERAVDEELISEERAELMLARAALAKAIDPEDALAQVLGITAEELQAAHDEGKTLREIARDLAEELDLDLATLRENMMAAREESIQQAVEDGAITPEQAELLLNGPDFGSRGFPGPGGSGGFRPSGSARSSGGFSPFQNGVNFPAPTGRA
jgi:hypothetical protein